MWFGLKLLRTHSSGWMNCRVDYNLEFHARNVMLLTFERFIVFLNDYANGGLTI